MPNKKIPNSEKGQLSVEIVIIAGVMMMVLFAVVFVNDHLRSAWELQKQKLQASAAVSQVAIAINRAAAGGNTTRIVFDNVVGSSITNMSLYGGRSLRAYYVLGGFYSVPLVTNQTSAIGGIPLNREITVENIGGTISIYAN